MERGGARTGTRDADVCSGHMWCGRVRGGGMRVLEVLSYSSSDPRYYVTPVSLAFAIPVTNHAQIRGVWQLQKVTVQYCKHSGSSIGVR